MRDSLAWLHCRSVEEPVHARSGSNSVSEVVVGEALVLNRHEREEAVAAWHLQVELMVVWANVLC